MKKIYLTWFISLYTLTAGAQNLDWQFHTYHHDTFNEDKGYAVIQTKDGGYVFAGKYGVNGIGNGDVYIGKLSSTGALLWTKVYGDSLGDEARAIKELSDGSFIVSGFTFQMGGANTDNSYKNLLMKLDANGDSLWTRRYGSAGIAVPEGLGGGVDTTDDGGFVFTGKYANGSNGNDFYIVKTDANGDSVWTKLYGGTGSDIPRSIVKTSDGGFIVSGTTKSYGATAVRGNMWLLKLNSSGDTVWTKVIGSGSDEECFMARPTADGGYILAGRTGNNSDMASELFAVKTNANGDSIWGKSFGNPSENDFGRDIVQTADKGYALIGARVATHGYYLLFPQLLYVVKMDSMGTKQWDKELGYDNSPNGANGYSIANTADGGLTASGFDQPDTASGGTEEIRVFIVKFSPLPTAVSDNETGYSAFYPNPFHDEATLIIPENYNDALLNIYNAEGQIVYTTRMNDKRIKISKKELPAGMYFYSVLSKEQSIFYRGKFIAQ